MPSKSKSEGRSRSRSRSRGRSRSRSRGRPKSPSRTKQNKEKQSPSPSRQRKQAVTKTPTTPTRSSTRIKQIVEKEIQKVQEEEQLTQGDNKQVFKQVSKGETKQAKTNSCWAICSSVEPALKCAGKVISGVLGLAFMPMFVLYMLKYCNKKSCTPSFKELPRLPITLNAYYDRDVMLLFAGFVASQAALLALPLGKVVKGSSARGGKPSLYRCNGIFAMCVTLMAMAGGVYYKLPLTIVYDKLFQFAATAISWSFIGAAIAFITARKLKTNDRSAYGSTGFFLQDYTSGRAIQPRLGPIDLKQLYARIGVMAWMIVNISMVLKTFQDKTFNPTIGLMALMHGLLQVDFIIFEENVGTTFFMKHFGFGFEYIFMWIAFVPFYVSITLRFLVEHQVNWHMGCLSGFLVLHLIGYIIYRGSNSEKDRFRRDPHNPMFANFVKIPSPTGQKLLASGWWGLCRQPNYLGDLIMAIAWTLPLGCQGSCLATIYPITQVFSLLYGSYMRNKACEKRHGAAWERYCREVKYQFIPHLY